jgi:hypothetical protein
LDGAGRLIGFGAGAGCLKLLMGLDLVDPVMAYILRSTTLPVARSVMLMVTTASGIVVTFPVQ